MTCELNVQGTKKLSRAPVEASDSRDAAAPVLAALSAEGTSTITGLEKLWRDYSSFEYRLSSLGANIDFEEKFPEMRYEASGE